MAERFETSTREARSEAQPSEGRSRRTPASVAAEAELALPVLTLPSAHPCHGCGACCRYVAVGIENPTTPRQYDQVAWYLSHRGMSVYVDWEGDWYVEFQTLCDHLTPELTCAIYTERPEICSDFSYEECEPRTGEPGARYEFKSAADLRDWLARRRPRAFERYMKFRAELQARRSTPRPRSGAASSPRPPAPSLPRAPVRSRP